MNDDTPNSNESRVADQPAVKADETAVNSGAAKKAAKAPRKKAAAKKAIAKKATAKKTTAKKATARKAAAKKASTKAAAKRTPAKKAAPKKAAAKRQAKPASALIVGAGFAGLGMAIRLKQAGVNDFVNPQGIGSIPGFGDKHLLDLSNSKLNNGHIYSPRSSWQITVYSSFIISMT